MDMARSDMVSDARKGTKVNSIEPYVAKYVIQHRTGLSSDLFKVGKDNKDMSPEKLINLEQTAKAAAMKVSNSSEVSKERVQKGLDAIARSWNSDAGKKQRDKFTGNNNESAFYQYAISELNKQLKD